MKRKKYTHGITFFVSSDSYYDIKYMSDALIISTSELIRRAVEEYIRKLDNPRKEEKQNEQ